MPLSASSAARLSEADLEFLVGQTTSLVEFAKGSAHPDGGFAWLDDSGRPELGRPVELWVTCRMTHCYALGDLLGRPGSAARADRLGCSPPWW